MSFWNTTTEPKRNFRYRVEIEGFEKVSNENANEKLWFAKKATKPSFTVGEVKANFVDKTFYYPGRVEWNTVEIVFYDPNNPNVVNHLAQMFANSGYFIPSDTDATGNYGSTAKSNATAAESLGKVVVTTIDEDGEPLEEWELHNSFIKSMKFGDVSYDSDDLLEVSVEIRYDWASLTSTGFTGTVFNTSSGKNPPGKLTGP